MQETYGCYSVLKNSAGTPIKLGQNELGEVYKAFNSELRCYAALRVLPKSIIPDEAARDQWVREAKAASHLHQRHLASVFPLESTGDTFLFGSEFCDGETLAARVAREGPLPRKAALALALSLAAALEVVSAAGLTHRRLSARNIMLSDDGDEAPAPKLLDLAVPRIGPFNPPPEEDFRSPEEREGRAMDPRSNIYSLGALLYYIIAGGEGFAAFRTKTGGRLETLLAGPTVVDPDCAPIFQKTLGTAPESRARDFEELRELLDRAITGRVRPESVPAPRPVAKDLAPVAVTKAPSVPRPTPDAVELRSQSAPLPVAEPVVAQTRHAETPVHKVEVPPAPSPVREEPKPVPPQAASASAPPAATANVPAKRKEARRSGPVSLIQIEKSAPPSRVKPPAKAEDDAATGGAVGARSGGLPWVWLGLAAALLLAGVVFACLWPGGKHPSLSTNTASGTSSATSIVAVVPNPASPNSPSTPPPLPSPPTSGPLTVISDPVGAAVSLDDGPPEAAPHTFADVSYGLHKISATMDRYSPSSLSIVFNGEKNLQIVLKPVPVKAPNAMDLLAESIKKEPHDSPQFIKDSVSYLEEVRKTPPSDELDPQDVRQDVTSALTSLRDSMATLKPSQCKQLIEPYGNEIVKAAELDIFPAILLTADYKSDLHEAFKWFYYAAMVKHNAYSMRRLGQLYESGFGNAEGVRQPEEAFHCFKAAAEAGDKPAAVYLCQCYLKGLGTKSDPQKGLADLNALADDGVGLAEALLAQYEIQSLSGHIPGLESLEKQDRQARLDRAIDLCHKAIQHNVPAGHFWLGAIYQNGLVNGKQDLAAAKDEYQKGADGEDGNCLFALGRLLYSEAADGGDEAAMKQKAVTLILSSAAQHQPQAEAWVADPQNAEVIRETKLAAPAP